jgi:hypothetical protein
LVSKSAKSQSVLGIGSAILADVLQGYPYATIRASVTKNDLSSVMNDEVSKKGLFSRRRMTSPFQLNSKLSKTAVEQHIVNDKLVENLAGEVERAIQNLRHELALKK